VSSLNKVGPGGVGKRKKGFNKKKKNVTKNGTKAFTNREKEGQQRATRRPVRHVGSGGGELKEKNANHKRKGKKDWENRKGKGGTKEPKGERKKKPSIDRRKPTH